MHPMMTHKTPPPNPDDSSFKTGAVRSSAVAHLSFTSLPMIGLIALARTAGEGAEKYGRFNYMLGMPVHDLLDHSFAHLVNYCAGDRSEPHLAHAAWGILAAIQSEALDPEFSAPHMLGPGSTVTEAMRDHMSANAPRLAGKRRRGEFSESGNWKVSKLPEVEKLVNQRGEARVATTGADDCENIALDATREGLPSRLSRAMRARGYSPGTLVELPDGLNPCGTCPFDVACDTLGRANLDPTLDAQPPRHSAYRA